METLAVNICEICDDSNADVIEPSSGNTYHRECIRYQRDNPDNHRMARGRAYLLTQVVPLEC